MDLDFYGKRVQQIIAQAKKLGRNSLYALALFAMSAILLMVVFVKTAGFLVNSVVTASQIKKAMSQNNLDPNQTKIYIDAYKKTADQIKKNNLFVPSEQKKHPVNQVNGILGSEVLINGKWYKKGDKISDAVIVEILPTEVVIEWNGNKKNFAPISAVDSNQDGKKEVNSGRKDHRPKDANSVKTEKPAQIRKESAESDPLAWMGVKLSPKVRDMLLQRWNKMTDEQKQKWKDQWNQMSDEQKNQAAEQMESHL